MLILTRRVGETVVIGESIFCTVLGFRGGEVKLAFDAPQSIPVHRNEIQQRIWREKGEHSDDQAHLKQKETVVEGLISRFKRASEASTSL